MKVRRGPLYNIHLGLARAAIYWEQLWPALWPATAVAGMFLVVALLDGFALLPLWLHVILLIGFLVAFLAGVQRVATHLPRIRITDARHRIEVDSSLDNRPLTALDDDLAAGSDDPNAVALWLEHRRRMQAKSEDLRLKMPAAGLARRDPWAFRAALGVALLVGVVAAGTDSGNRIARALVPDLDAGRFTNLTNFSVWITPPAYTQLPPVLIDNASQAVADKRIGTAEDPLRVPTGSALLAQVSGGGTTPRLSVDETETEFSRVEADSYHLETKLTEAQTIGIRQSGRELAGWTINVVPDTVPKIEFTGAVDATPRLRIQIPFKAGDDYRLKSVTASIRRIDGLAVPGGDKEIVLQLPLPPQGKNEVSLKSSHDLTAHVWAGLPVLIHLLATDDLGQTGVSTVEPAIMPERNFTNPVAREIADIRKHLVADGQSRRLAALKIDNVAEAPERFLSDNVVFLSLRVARQRLRYDPREVAVAEVQKILWDTALRVEDGVSAIASRDLRAAQRALQEALKRGASPQELERLMAEVQRALDRFLSSLLRQFQQQDNQQQIDPNDRIVGSDELQRMLDRARELMRQGSLDAARQLMAELQRMLEGMRRGTARNGQMNQQMRQAQRAMRELRGIIQRQQKLLDETFKRSEERGDSPLEKEQGEQRGIRGQLGKMMEQLGNILGRVPPGLGRAERAMRESERALGRGAANEAVDPQNRALSELRRGAQSAARGMARQMRPGQGRQFGPGGQFGRFDGPRLRGLRPGNRDPFGRPTEEGNQGTATGSVKIPGESEMQRAREILDELRKRAGDLWRPELELEYIERLLRRF